MSQLKSYEYVIAIVEQGGISQAAEALHIAQPALSRYLKKLEADLETDLFDRSVIPIRLTEAGRLYVEDPCGTAAACQATGGAAFGTECRGSCRHQPHTIALLDACADRCVPFSSP